MPDIARLQRILLAAPGMFVLLRSDAGHTIVGASAAYLEATHVDAGIVGRPLFDVFPANPSLDGGAGYRTMEAALQRAITTRLPVGLAVVRYDVPRAGLHGDGFEARYWSPMIVPVLSEEGEVDLLMLRVEDASATANVKAIEILESITEGFFTLDRQWRFDYVNAEAHRILGVQPGELAGRIIWEVYPGLEETPFWHSYHLTMTSRVKSSFTAHYAHQQRWYEVTVFPAPEGIAVYFRNVTASKAREAQREALVSLSEQLATAHGPVDAAYAGASALGPTLDASRVGYGTIDAGASLHVHRDWTRAGVESLAGETPLRNYGSFFDSLAAGESIVIGDVREDARTAGAASALEARHARSFVNIPILERGSLVAVLFVNDDKARAWTRDELDYIREAAARTRAVVERATAEAELRSSEEMYRRLSIELAEAGKQKDEFLATLAHELRNPLAPLRNALKILDLAPQDAALIVRTRELMERQVVHMVRLIDDLLDVSRLSRGMVDMQLQPVSLADAIGTALEASRPFVEQASHELAVSLPTTQLVVNGDPVRLTQVITNLLNNAAKFTPAGGRISLSLEREGDHALVRVTDNGVGLDPHMIDRVFNMFEQVDRSHAQVTGGLGIGLTLVRRLVEAQGGTVQAESAGLGTGSAFTVRLPLVPGAAEVAPLVEGQSSGTSSGLPRRILIADDNVDAGRSLAMYLDLFGHETRVVEDGARAVSVAREFKPDVVILDIAMPVLDGLEAARAIRASSGERAPYLIALTGFGQEADKQRSEASGFDVHLVKPVHLARVTDLIDRSAAGAPGS